MAGSGQVDDDNGNSDNRATSAQFQLKLPTGDELGKKLFLKYVFTLAEVVQPLIGYWAPYSLRHGMISNVSIGPRPFIIIIKN